MSGAERRDKGFSTEEASAAVKIVKRYLTSSNLLERVPKNLIPKLCVSQASVELEAFKIRESTEALQQTKLELADINAKRFRLNPDNVKITKSTCSLHEREIAVFPEPYFAEINCNLFFLKVGGRSLEETKANLDEQFVELMQDLFV